MPIDSGYLFLVLTEVEDISFMLIDLGLQERRLDGEEYVEVIDEFMEAVFTRWPHVIVQVLWFI